MDKKNIIIAGGGTGGHIYPGIAIAKELHSLDPTVEIHFVGTPQGLENKIVPKEGFKLHLIRVGKLNESGIKGKIKTLLSIPVAFVKSVIILWELKPIFVLGVGGYVSGPFVLMAALLGFPSGVWEPNAYPGLTNRWLSRFVKICFVVFDEAKRFLKNKNVETLGIPIRKEIELLAQRQLATENLNKEQLADREHKKFHLLIFGGSQGARAINKVIKEMMIKDSSWRSDIEIIHQTGPHDYKEVSEAYHGKSGVECKEYLHHMEEYYSWADLIICRSGASTVAEIAACQKSAIFIPLPWAADDHQRKNAQALVNKKAAQMILQSDLNPDTLMAKILELKKNQELRMNMQKQLIEFYKPHSAQLIGKRMLSEVSQ